MSLNYTTLQTEILALAHRADLTAEVVGFIRRAEGLIRRDLRAYPLSVTLDEDDRSALGVYTLPSGFLELRTAIGPGGFALENVGATGIRQLPASADVQHYAVLGDTIEFRGVPGTDAEIELKYLGVPDPLATTATNDLLTDHEDLYIAGATHYLRKFEEDEDGAAKELDKFKDLINAINAQYGRRLGGGSILPAYNFGHIRVGTGY